MDVLRFLLSIPFKLIRLFGWFIVFCIRLLEKILSPFIGKIQWSTPVWIDFFARHLRKIENGIVGHPKTALGSIIFLIIALFGSVILMVKGIVR
ncbi:hypothetical protein [Proteus terrae]|uniref:hypothetical protein n=1 Tax=Proteus terrae TaxID=1574161 RepID=UPI000D68A66D|nr:hypothetical protein [Proteus terrae]